MTLLKCRRLRLCLPRAPLDRASSTRRQPALRLAEAEGAAAAAAAALATAVAARVRVLRPLQPLKPPPSLQYMSPPKSPPAAVAAGGAVALRAYADLPTGAELTRCYAGCLKQSALDFAACDIDVRERVLRKKGFKFECRCHLCVRQRGEARGRSV